MSTKELINKLLEHLEAGRLRGREYVDLSRENSEFLMQTPKAKGASPPSRPKPPSGPAAPATAPGREPTVGESLLPERSPQNLGECTWDELQELVRNCTRCKLCRLGRKQTVFGAGDPAAELMFIGEGPGADEDRQGIPFVGEAGKLLTKIIEAMGLTRDTVYIANIVKCRPPGNRNPEEDEGNTCLAYLKRQIELIQPKVIVLLGNTPLQFLMGRKGITKQRGNWLEYGKITVMPTFHPAFLKRKPSGKREVWDDMQQVMAKLGKTPPPGSTNTPRR